MSLYDPPEVAKLRGLLETQRQEITALQARCTNLGEDVHRLIEESAAKQAQVESLTRCRTCKGALAVNTCHICCGLMANLDRLDKAQAQVEALTKERDASVALARVVGHEAAAQIEALRVALEKPCQHQEAHVSECHQLLALSSTQPHLSKCGYCGHAKHGPLCWEVKNEKGVATCPCPENLACPPSSEGKPCPTRINRPCEPNELDPRICQYCFKERP